MKTPATSLVSALAIAIPAALGGALVVFSGYDDAPGGQLLGLLLIIGAVVLGGKTARRR